MANPNPPLDPNILEKAKMAGFGTENGADPREAQAKGVEARAANKLARAELRYMFLQPFDHTTDKEKIREHIQGLSKAADGTTNLAKIMASTMLEAGIMNGDIEGCNKIIENVEGKLKEKLEIIPPKPLPEDNKDLTAANAAYAQMTGQ